VQFVRAARWNQQKTILASKWKKSAKKNSDETSSWAEKSFYLPASPEKKKSHSHIVLDRYRPRYRRTPTKLAK